ncbi:MAG: transketolase [Sedimentisphaerales bacterium]|jgi:transketolase|nr:transketolase [Sedimentisphaerales bacterium]
MGSVALSDRQLRIKSIQYRLKILKYIKMANAGHTGGSLSCIDILNVLYNRILRVSPQTFGHPDRDRYIQSKGHSVEALYVVLADRGFFGESELETLCRYMSRLAGHPTRKVPGIEHNTGALGHGLAFAVGVALTGKKDGRAYRVFVLLGDGELDEGSNWEAMMAASHYGLDNLIAIVDRNMLQITGPTEQVCRLEPLADKLAAFGWSVRIADGHDIPALTDVLSAVPFEPGRPSAIIARTTKGKGVSFMEYDPSWHHGVPDNQQYEIAQQQLEQLLREAGGGQ